MMLALKRHFRKAAVTPALLGAGPAVTGWFLGRNNGKVKSDPHKFYFIKSRNDLGWKGS